MVPRLVQLLAPVVDAGQLVVITDAEGRVLWRSGNAGVRRMADDLGFVEGSAWTEGNVGTNAIGTALVLGEPFFIKGAEHFVESHARWGCAAAPITDPWTGRTLGIVDVSGPSRGLHPAELALVEMAARVCSLEVLEQHRAGLDALRSHAAPLLARIGGAALVVDRHGHLARSGGHGCAQPDRASGRHGRGPDLDPVDGGRGRRGPAGRLAAPSGRGRPGRHRGRARPDR